MFDGANASDPNLMATVRGGKEHSNRLIGTRRLVSGALMRRREPDPRAAAVVRPCRVPPQVWQGTVQASRILSRVMRWGLAVVSCFPGGG